MRVAGFLLTLCALACSRAPEKPRSLADQHAQIDELLQVGQLADAERMLNGMWRTLLHDHAESTSFGLRALQDVAFRLGQVMLDEKKPVEALEVCTRGLALGKTDDIFTRGLGLGDDLFTANLLILRGNIEQELGKSLAAAQDFHQALVINEKLLQEVLHR